MLVTIANTIKRYLDMLTFISEKIMIIFGASAVRRFFLGGPTSLIL